MNYFETTNTKQNDKQYDIIINQDFENLTYKDVVNIKKAASTIKRRLDRFVFVDNKYEDLISDMIKFNILFDSYGVLNHPVKDYISKVRKGYRAIEKICTNITEDFILENIDFYAKKQKFNPIVIGEFREQDLINDLTELKNVHNWYSYFKYSAEAENKRTQLYKHVLRSENKDVYEEQPGEFIVVQYIKSSNEFISQHFYFRNWDIFTGTENIIDITKGDMLNDKIYKQSIKKIYPELYL